MDHAGCWKNWPALSNDIRDPFPVWTSILPTGSSRFLTTVLQPLEEGEAQEDRDHAREILLSLV